MYDIIVIGAGLAGGVVSNLLNQKGYKVILLERGGSPNCHLPETFIKNQYCDILNSLGVENKIKESFINDSTSYFVSLDGTQKVQISHSQTNKDSDPQIVRLDRRLFDKILLDASIKKGAEVLFGCNVTKVKFSDNQNKVDYIIDGKQQSSTARFIIDTSGKSALIGRQLGILQQGKKLDSRIALFTHYEASNFSDKLQYLATYISKLKHGYSFVIPISKDRITVGIVVAEDIYDPNIDFETIFNIELNNINWIKEIILNAKRVLPIIPAINNSYICSPSFTKNYCLLGEAAQFLDPFYSNGIGITLESSKLATKTIDTILSDTNDLAIQDICSKYQKEADQIASSNGDLYETVMQQQNIQFGNFPLADPHLPYNISQFLLGLNTDNVGSPYAQMCNVRDKFKNKEKQRITA